MKSEVMFAFGELSQAKMQGSAPLLCAESAGAEFSPRTQAGFARWGKERLVEESNLTEL